MPATTINKTSSSNARKSIRRRKKQTGAGRKRSLGTKKDNSKVIANSIFAIKVKPKPGIAVVEAHENFKRRGNEDNYQQMYQDLLAAVQNALKIMSGTITRTDPFKEGLSLSSSLAFVISMFEKEVLPKNYHYNIDRDNEQYYFTIYKSCEMQQFWHAFEIQPMVEYTRKNKKLHVLFLVAIKTFMSRADINGWWDLNYAFVEDIMEEEILNWTDNHDDDEESMQELASAQADLKLYKNGEANMYHLLLNNCGTENPEILIKRLRRFNQKNPVVKWLIALCEFLKQPSCMNDFVYYEYESEGVEGVRFHDQVNIIWKWDNDFLSKTVEDYLDSEANGCGVLDPVINYQISKTTRAIDIKELNNRSAWPQQLTKLFHLHRASIEAIKK